MKQRKARKTQKWMAGATANAHGQFARKAKRAGMSTLEFARKESHAPGKLGRQARLAKVLIRASRGKRKARR